MVKDAGRRKGGGAGWSLVESDLVRSNRKHDKLPTLYL